MISRAFVQVQNPSRPLVEARSLLEALPERGIPVERYSLKQLHRGKVPLEPDTLIAGDMDAVPWALRRLLGDACFLASYPASLMSHLGRRVWTSTVGEVRRRVELEQRPLFVKPKDKQKRFTGFVYESVADEVGFRGSSSRLPVFVSEAVRFLSEYRVYVAKGEVVGLAPYMGESEDAPPSRWIESLIDALRQADELVAGFSLDVGRLDTGEWALVECNEGFALGQYSPLPPNAYADVIVARWEELALRTTQSARV